MHDVIFRNMYVYMKKKIYKHIFSKALVIQCDEMVWPA